MHNCLCDPTFSHLVEHWLVTGRCTDGHGHSICRGYWRLSIASCGKCCCSRYHILPFWCCHHCLNLK